MQYQVEKLDGLALDYAVAMCIFHGCEYDQDDLIKIAARQRYSREWAHGGLIIQAHHIEFDYDETANKFQAYDGIYAAGGPTHLIAAMRCFVISKLGVSVILPHEFYD